jgi:hypothetical protein
VAAERRSENDSRPVQVKNIYIFGTDLLLRYVWMICIREMEHKKIIRDVGQIIAVSTQPLSRPTTPESDIEGSPASSYMGDDMMNIFQPYACYPSAEQVQQCATNKVELLKCMSKYVRFDGFVSKQALLLGMKGVLPPSCKGLVFEFMGIFVDSG